MSRHTRILTLITALIALAVPASAGAASWSAPAVLAPAPAGDTTAAAPLAFAAGATSLVVSSDGVTPWLARGDARGAFASPVPLAPAGAGSPAADADLGADGTLAVAWASGGAVHVTVVPAGQAPRAPLDVPAAGASGAAVAVAPDGTITVAFRTKVGTTYAIGVASAPPGGAFGTPVTLESGSAGMDAPDVAAGAGGAAAVTYRKILTRYRARVAVRPAGAPAFEAPETMPGGEQAVIRTQVAIGGDGHVVAGWVDGAAAHYATRAPGAPAFAAPAKLDDGAFALQLVPTPQGGTAAAWAGSGSVRAAVRAPSGAFGAPVAVGTYTSPIVSDPAIAVAASGVATVAYNDPSDGAVRVADLGSPSRVVGYGAPATANSPAIAQGAVADGRGMARRHGRDRGGDAQRRGRPGVAGSRARGTGSDEAEAHRADALAQRPRDAPHEDRDDQGDVERAGLVRGDRRPDDPSRLTHRARADAAVRGEDAAQRQAVDPHHARVARGEGPAQGAEGRAQGRSVDRPDGLRPRRQHHPEDHPAEAARLTNGPGHAGSGRPLDPRARPVARQQTTSRWNGRSAAVPPASRVRTRSVVTFVASTAAAPASSMMVSVAW